VGKWLNHMEIRITYLWDWGQKHDLNLSLYTEFGSINGLFQGFPQ